MLLWLTKLYIHLQVLIELPYILAQAAVYGVITYAMMGFEWSVTKFFWYIFFMYFTLLYFTFYGMMVVALTPNHHVSAIVSAAFYGIWNVFSGFVIPKTVSPGKFHHSFWGCPLKILFQESLHHSAADSVVLSRKFSLGVTILLQVITQTQMQRKFLAGFSNE